MATLSLGAVAGGVAPQVTDWTQLSVPNTSGNYLFGQTTRSMIARVQWVNNAFVVTVADQDFSGTTYSHWYNTNPVANPTGWVGGVLSGQRGTIAGYNSSQGKYYYGGGGVGSGWLVTSNSQFGTLENTSTSTTYWNYYGWYYNPTGIDHNGVRTMITYRSNSNNDVGTVWMWEGSYWSQKESWNSYKFNDVAYLGYYAPNDQHVWVTVSDGGLMNRSTNNGDSFTDRRQIDSAQPSQNLTKIASNRAGKAVIRGYYCLLTTTNYGESWTKTFTDPTLYSSLNVVNAPGNNYITSHPMSLTWSDDDNCFVYVNGDQQWYSDANGANWTRNTKFTGAGAGLTNSVAAYSPTLKYWLAVGAKTSTDQYSTGLAKGLAWTNNIKGI